MAEATLKAKEGSVLDIREELEDAKLPDYTEEEKTYIGNLQKRLESARTLRDQNHGEFDSLTFIDHWWANERGANTSLKNKTNKGEPTFQSGTLRTKMDSFLSTFQGLNLMPDITAFSKNQFPINALGDGMEDIMEKCGELENDEEKRSLRQYELMKQGTVFVEDMWDDRYIVEKTVKQSFKGIKKDTKWTSKRVKADSRPIRRLLPATAVYLGDLTKYLLEDQPYLYTVEIINYEEAEQIYGNWEMWEYVSKKKRSFTGNENVSMILNAWRLTNEASDNKVEVIKYQDKLANEFQIILNGIPMLPMGYPLTELSPDGEYTIVQQNLQPIRHTFSYGKSFIFKNKNLVAVLDQMMKMAVLKTYKSFMPPYLNISDRVVSRDVFMPAKVTRGIQPGQLVPVSEQETRGVTPSEFSMIQEMIKTIDRNTASQTTTGAKETGGKVTATQILELQRQAKIMMGLVVLSAMLLEKKLAHKRLALILKNWFDPIDKTADTARGMLKNRYRTTAMERNIEGEGQGMRMVIPIEKLPKPEQVKQMEEKATEKTGVPIKMIILNPKEVKQAKLVWVINVNPKEKKSSEFSKVMFDEMIVRLHNIGLPVNPDWEMERFAEVWEEDPGKMFLRGQTPMMPPGTPPEAAGAPTGQGQTEKRVMTPKITPRLEGTPSKGVLG